MSSVLIDAFLRPDDDDVWAVSVEASRATLRLPGDLSVHWLGGDVRRRAVLTLRRAADAIEAEP